MSTFYTLLTNIGLAKITNAQLLGEVVQWTQMAVGDGNGNPTTPTTAQTALVRERYRATLSSLTVDPANDNYMIAEMVVPTTVGGWSVNEVGIFDADGDLVAVANFPATYKPQLSEGSGRDLIIRVIVQVSNASVVTLVADPAIILASRKWVIDNFSAAKLFPGGTVNQILAKKSNTDGDTEWRNASEGVVVIVSSQEETQTLAAGQTVVDLADITTNGAAVYIEGVRLAAALFVRTSATRITLAQSYPAGSRVTVVQNEETSSISTGTVYLSGNVTTYVNQVKTFTITNFNAFSTYAVTATAGTVSLSGDTVTYTAPATTGAVSFTVTMDGAANPFPLTVLASGVSTPSITSPAAGATGVLDTPTVTSSAFAWVGVSDTHLNSDWQLATDAAFTNVVQSSMASTTNRTSWTLGALAVSTTYHLRVRHRGTNNGVSAYSPTVSFTTAASFNWFIPTPTATPAIGGAFQGGFYAGMIWNELIQTSTSTTIGTGSRTFSVSLLGGAAIVYSGQTLEVRSRANPANRMIGTVTAATTTSVTINVTSVGGSGTFTDWSIMAQYRIIVAPKASGESAALVYKNASTAAPTACQTLTEGLKATRAMVEAGLATVYPAAYFCNDLIINAYDDWYLPARDELELCWRNLKPTTDNNFASATRPDSSFNYANLGSFDDITIDNGTNLNSSPAGAAYTTTVPARTSVTAFQTGGAEAFAYGSAWYWSSSDFDNMHAFAQYWSSGGGGGQQARNVKTGEGRVRAVRRSII